MKKIIITTIAGIILATVITGCGKDTEKTSKEEHSNVEEIKVEYIDDEYQNELDYNSNVNTWENNSKIICSFFFAFFTLYIMTKNKEV